MSQSVFVQLAVHLVCLNILNVRKVKVKDANIRKVVSFSGFCFIWFVYVSACICFFILLQFCVFYDFVSWSQINFDLVFLTLQNVERYEIAEPNNGDTNDSINYSGTYKMCIVSVFVFRCTTTTQRYGLFIVVVVHSNGAKSKTEAPLNRQLFGYMFGAIV